MMPLLECKECDEMCILLDIIPALGRKTDRIGNAILRFARHTCRRAIKTNVSFFVIVRPQSRSLESQTAGLQSLWLARRLKPWLVTIDGL